MGPRGIDVVRAASFPLGVVTSIGSLPHRTSADAVRFVLRHAPDLPAAPSIPAHEPLEGMLAQVGWGVRGVAIAADGTLSVPDPAVLDPAAAVGDPELAGAPFATIRTFLAAVADRTGPIKLQVTGPVTFGLALIDAGVPAELAFRVAAAAVRTRATGLVELAARLAPGAPPVVFLDEPGLVGGLRADVPLTPDATIDLVSGVLAALEPKAVTGIHCCGPADWRVVLQAGPQVLSLPVDAGIAASAGALAGFLERGGIVAWGAVPTDGPLGEQPSRLWRHLSDQWCALVQAGCDPVLLRRQAIITPVCGLALHDEVLAEHVFTLSGRIAERLHDQITGIRLSVGA
ncbi:MAG: hypothetical protein JWM05_3165 [Acidimicrobiales bacterium]|nr:hypothetical protein [Acidimicrobiales bacterium]